MKGFSKIAKLCLLSSSIVLATGCSTINNMYNAVEATVADHQFESRIVESQDHILDAKVLLAQGQFDEAKSHLDKAYSLYPRQASLHDTYKRYYEALGNEKLARLAMARYEKMVVKSNALNEKGRYAMESMNALKLAGDLFNLSLVYHDENTSTLINITTLGYTTGDYHLAKSSLRMLHKLGHMSPESTMLDFLVAQVEGDKEHMQIVRKVMRKSWPTSPQYKFVSMAYLHNS